MPRLSIIIPVLDEGDAIAGTLDALAPMRKRGVEVIVVDGGSRDATVQRARMRADHVMSAPPGRAISMNAGAQKAQSDVLLFLRGDTRLPENAETLVLDGLARTGRAWGRFDVMIEGQHPLLAIVGRLVNIRSRLTGIATGDQAIFVRRAAFQVAGGFPAIPLMEDIALSKRLRQISRPLCIGARAITSGRPWEAQGLLPTLLRMGRLRLAYHFGTDPAELAKQYGTERN